MQIRPDFVPIPFQHGVILFGGAIRDMVRGVTPTDYDLLFPNSGQAAAYVFNHLAGWKLLQRVGLFDNDYGETGVTQIARMQHAENPDLRIDICIGEVFHLYDHLDFHCNSLSFEMGTNTLRGVTNIFEIFDQIHRGLAVAYNNLSNISGHRLTKMEERGFNCISTSQWNKILAGEITSEEARRTPEPQTLSAADVIAEHARRQDPPF